MKKLSILTATILISATLISTVFARIDEMIFTDPVVNTYLGRVDAKSIIANTDFKDMKNHWAQESVTRVSALNIVKGYDDNFNPNGTVSKQEAIAFVVRAIGLEKEAQAAAIQISATRDPNSPLKTLWSLGYLDIALQRGIITQAQYNDSLVIDQTILDPTINFVRDSMATREDVADYLFKGLNSVNADIFVTPNTVQSIYNYLDWDKIDVNKIPSVEAITSNKIMTGKDNGTFNPKGKMTRAEVAQTLKNLDSIYFSIVGIEKKTGTIGGIKDNQVSVTGKTETWRNVYIRKADGAVDVLQSSLERNSSPQAKFYDAVVYKDGKVSGLGTLTEGDQVEYLIDTATGTVLYVQVANSAIKELKVQGKLYSFDYNTGEINITGDSEKQFIFPLVKGIYGTENNMKYIIMDDKKRDIKKLPIGSKVELFLKNNIVNEIKYIGEQVIVPETRGIVIENNQEFGYITVVTNNGSEITKNYNSSDIKVEKQQHYDLDDEIGYLDQIFKSNVYDPRDTVIEDIEPGDIVFIRTFKDDSETIEYISAASNYIMQYGKIKEFINNEKYFDMLVEFEDKQTAWFSVANSIFISKDGKPIKKSDIQVGDYTKILVNQAILSPGYIIESVKEMVIEGDEHYISKIIKGQLSGINNIQNELLIQNAQTLNKTGWFDYKELQKFSLKGKDIEYYFDEKRISLDYAMKYLKRSDGFVYVALENNYAGENVKKVSFRSERDELLNSDTVVTADGNGSFKILSNNGTIKTDAGTIVRRNGRLVDGTNIMASDYTVVSLNGENNAAVVDITQAPNISGIMISRGRIKTVDDGKSFKVQSMATLNNMNWLYSPVQRDYTIDYNTLYINESGVVSIEKFMDYTSDSVIDKVYNIVVDGQKATHIMESPYSQLGVRGTIYEKSEGVLKIKDATYYDNTTGKWSTVSDKDNTLEITLHTNSIIGKNNKMVQQSQLEKGDVIKVMTDKLPPKVTSGIKVDGYIILVEK